MIKAIETVYQGYRFRSRLEARWGVFFDVMAIKWDYELEGFDLDALGYYLPDFWLRDIGCWAEVKPEQFTADEYAKCNALEEPCLLLDSVPEVRAYYAISKWEWPPHLDSYEAYVNCNTGQHGLSPTWGMINLEWSQFKGRLFHFFGEGLDAYWFNDFPGAVVAARQARFEHGESPWTGQHKRRRAMISSPG